ncbi:PDDEXK nuclease domain-containing protein [Dyadobacter fanqingshengii]|uniref:PDDEXK nuclease domain-containing protein n=1 Tax=Dyadobacter fanqingshengii TaxID=2906443 RepID=A0A9X1PGJ0_9BACT|nr:PDDEXK nuclease domain-containing protein [Dyadobacter fanqingshengii]MCF0043320.1 PDDEXK nuclease domain-containing protein [Dyadobacter fanqingshengii]USJ35793.1 PDDEXK nuclease domain-containing protein [Dyadobacter fanqingshengii]
MNEEVKPTELISSVRQLIKESRSRVAVAVNAEITMLYYQIGKRINEDVLRNDRAEYGKQVIRILSYDLVSEYGSGWSEKLIRHCMHFASVFPDSSIVSALRRQLSWTHLKSLMYIEDQLKREFYIEICRLENWSSRQLDERIKSMLYERTAISKKPEETIVNDLNLLRDKQKLNPDLVFRDPYFLDFLGLKDVYSEKDLETSIIVELQKFIIELGSDFAFMARQKRITIDNCDYFIDLLFYHRRLRCLVAIDLKMGAFEAGFKGQMELYLRFLEKYEQAEGENAPIGLILCSGKNKEHVELMQLDQANIRVADYLTALPSQELLQEKLHKAVEIARQKVNLKPT